jgi:hypothetical protein
VLGANDSIVSTASLIVGVAAAAAAQNVYTLNKDEERKRHALRRRSTISSVNAPLPQPMSIHRKPGCDVSQSRKVTLSFPS